MYTAFARLLGTRAAGWLSRKVVWRLDPYLMRLTRGRLGFGLLLPTNLMVCLELQKSAPDLARIDRLALVRKGGGAGDDKGVRDAPEIGDQALGDAVDETILVAVAAEVDEGKHDNRGSRSGRCLNGTFRDGGELANLRCHKVPPFSTTGGDD